MTDSETGDLPEAGQARPVEAQPPSLTNFEMPARAVLLVLIVATVVAYQFDLATVVRGPLSVVFFTLVPGACLMACARKVDPVTLLAMSITLSLAIDVSVVLVGLWAHLYSPGGLLWFLAVFCVVLLMGRSVVESALRYGESMREAQLAAKNAPVAEPVEAKQQ